eukprot:c25567_g1_i1 orf=371-1705(+)
MKTDMLGMIVTGHAPSDLDSVSATEDAAKKIRKPYTITKSRESWTEQEHDKFLEALQLFDRDWKKIEAFVGSKTVIQIRSHAQKYFLKVQKNGTGEHVPPARPKRKSSQPYPQKAGKSAPVIQQVSRAIVSASQPDPMYAVRGQSCTAFVPPVSSSLAISSWVHHTVPPTEATFMSKDVSDTDFGSISVIPGQDPSISSGTSSPGSLSQQFLRDNQGNRESCIQATPDFVEVYGFIGSVFDPNKTGHLKKLKEMDSIDRETVLLLMRNLSINLSSPDFEKHKLFLSVYGVGSMDPMPATGNSTEVQIDVPFAVPQPPCEAGDDTSISCRPGLSQSIKIGDFDSQLEPQQNATLLKVSTEGIEKDPQECCHSYDDEGNDSNDIGNVSEPVCTGSMALHVPENASIALQHPFLELSTAGSEVYGLGVQDGSLGAVEEDESSEIWWL